MGVLEDGSVGVHIVGVLATSMSRYKSILCLPSPKGTC